MIINKKYISILSLAIAILLCACSSDNPEVQTVSAEAQPVGGDIQVLAYAPPFANTDPTDAPAGFYAYTPDKTTNMGIYMLSGGAAIKEERITYNTNKWHAYFDMAANTPYTVYGYMPKTGSMSSSLTDVTENAAKLTITGIKPVTTDDICIITGVKETNTGLKEGQFGWYMANANDNFYMYLLLDHIYASVNFSMIIDAEYAQLRTIKLKTMKLRTDKGSVNATITLTHNDTGASPISSATYTSDGTSCEVEIFNDAEGTALDTTEPLIINAYFAPTFSGNMTMVTTYDVYDRKGNLIRKDCEATNKVPNLDAVRGQQVLANLTVNPTYLNVLSDPDLDNPTVKGKKE
jgi:hypothetical protein